jgi:hypothetical protein
MALEELLQGVRQEDERVERLERAIREAVPEWSLAEVIKTTIFAGALPANGGCCRSTGSWSHAHVHGAGQHRFGRRSASDQASLLSWPPYVLVEEESGSAHQ